MTWTLVHTTTWTGGPVAGVPAGVVLQDGWRDPSNDATATITAANLLQIGNGVFDVLVRPAAENVGDALVDVVLATPTVDSAHTVVLRKAGVGAGISAFYLFTFAPGDGAVSWNQYRASPGLGEEVIHQFPFKAAFTSGNAFRFVCYVKGITVVECGVFLRDTTAGVDLIGTTAADVNDIVYERWTHEPEARLQVAGDMGLASPHTDLFGLVSIYTDLAAVPDFPAARGRG